MTSNNDIPFLQQLGVADQPDLLGGAQVGTTLISDSKEPVHMAQNHQRILSSIQRLPFDLVERILLYALGYIGPQADTRKSCLMLARPPAAVNLDVRSSVWTLGHVCSAWRAVILSASRLWSHIYIKDPITSSSCFILQETLRRSQSQPLGITLIMNPVCGFDQRAAGLVDDLVSHSDRWESVELVGVPVKMLESLDGVRGLNQLHELRIFPRFTDPAEQWQCAPDCKFLLSVCNAPNLTVLGLGQGMAPMLDRPLPWHQIRDMTFPKLTLQKTFQVLKKMPSLVRLDLPWADDELSEESILLTHLDTVACFNKNILASLVLPALRRIVTCYSVPLFNSLVSCVQKSSASPYSLELELIPLPNQVLTLLPHIRALHTLKALRVSDWSFSSTVQDLVYSLIYDRDNAILLPLLDELVISTGIMTEDILQASKKFIISRWCLPPDAAVQRLKEFSLFIDRGQAQYELIRPGILQTYHNEGLNVVIGARDGLDGTETQLVAKVFRS